MTTDLKRTALLVCRWCLRPIVRILIGHGVMHREFVDLSKEVYVDIARREHGLRNRPTNIARTALLTGLDRKEISRIKDRLVNDKPATAIAHRQDRISRVLSGWHQDQDFLDEHSRPRVIRVSGATPSFDELARRYGGDVPGITILRELLRVKAVVVANDQVTVLRRNYRLDTADPQALVRAGSVLSDIGSTVTHNLYRDPDTLSRLEARATNANIPVGAEDAFRSFIYAEGQAFLERVDAWLTEHEADGQGDDAERVRLGIGIYWIQSDEGVITPP
jgi:hypothetical protein